MEVRSHPRLSDETGAMRAMFRARKEVFVDLLKWELPVLAGEFEVDQFDDGAAEYLILLDNEGRHRASTRLLRTDRPHLLKDLYPHLCAGPVPMGSMVREITRFCLDRHQQSSQRRIARDQLVSALAHHAIANGIATYTGVAELGWFEQIRRFGWHCEALGQPVAHAGMKLTALRIEITNETPELLRKGGCYQPATSLIAVTRSAGGVQ